MIRRLTHRAISGVRSKMQRNRTAVGNIPNHYQLSTCLTPPNWSTSSHITLPLVVSARGSTPSQTAREDRR